MSIVLYKPTESGVLRFQAVINLVVLAWQYV